jgi:SGNH domain (fused to AT3 domains)
MVALLRTAHPDLTIFDPLPFLCDEQYCYGIRDKKLLYRDNNHLSIDGSLYLGEAFAETMHGKL